jgi:phosphate-selective porin OprO/OprP
VIRRLWLNASGDFPEGWGYVVMGGLSGDLIRLQDVYLRHYTDTKEEIRVGQIRRFNALESEASNNNLPFLERSGMTNAFRPRRNLGASYYPAGTNWGASLGIFGGNMGGQPPGSDNISLDGRFFYYPLENLHLGGNFSQTYLNEQRERFAARGEASRPEETLVNTRIINGVEGYLTTGLEAYYQSDRLGLMAEWQHQSLDRIIPVSTTFNGGYVAAIYSLTGETRPLEKRLGGYGAIIPKEKVSEGGIGAWEVALRHSYLDLNDADIQGGRLDSNTLGLNWYPEPELKLMLNYIRHQTDSKSPFPNADLHYFLLRAQVLF